MDTLEAILADAKAARERGLQMLEIASRAAVGPNARFSKEFVMKTLQEDIAQSEALIKRLGGKENA